MTLLGGCSFSFVCFCVVCVGVCCCCCFVFVFFFLGGGGGVTAYIHNLVIKANRLNQVVHS